MTHSNPNLVPTTVTDKNGRVTTVHKKGATTTTSRSTAPAPTLGGTEKALKPTKASRIRRVSYVIESQVLLMEAVKAKVGRWIDQSTPEQLAVLDEAVGTSFDTISDHEKAVVSSILSPLTSSRAHTGAIHELLALRQAFCSDWAIANEPGECLDSLESLMYGLRGGSYTTPVDVSDEQVNRQNTALLRFAYELKERAPYGGFLPVYQSRVGRGMLETVYEYDSEDLKKLIRKYPERVDELIQFALDNETCEAHRLRALVEHEGHSSMTSGWL